MVKIRWEPEGSGLGVSSSASQSGGERNVAYKREAAQDNMNDEVKRSGRLDVVKGSVNQKGKESKKEMQRPDVGKRSVGLGKEIQNKDEHHADKGVNQKEPSEERSATSARNPGKEGNTSATPQTEKRNPAISAGAENETENMPPHTEERSQGRSVGGSAENRRLQGQSGAIRSGSQGQLEEVTDKIGQTDESQCKRVNERPGVGRSVGQKQLKEVVNGSATTGKSRHDGAILSEEKMNELSEKLLEKPSSTRHELNPQAAEWPVPKNEGVEERPDEWADIQEVLYSCGVDEERDGLYSDLPELEAAEPEWPIAPWVPSENAAETAVAWCLWIGKLENHFVKTRVEKDDDARRILLFLFGGDEIRRIVRDLGDVGEDSPYTEVVMALDTHYEASANPDRARYEARRSRQEWGKTIDEFHGRVRRLVRRYSGSGDDAEVRMQVIVGCQSEKLRAMIFRQPGIPIEDMLELGRAIEEEEVKKGVWGLDPDAAAWMENEQEQWCPPAAQDVEAERHEETSRGRSKVSRDGKNGNKGGPINQTNDSQTALAVGPTIEKKGAAICLNCGQTSHPVEGCWARGRRCIQCGVKGHVAMMCRGGRKKRRRKRSPGHWSPVAPGRGEAALIRERQEQEARRREAERKVPREESTGRVFCLTIRSGHGEGSQWRPEWAVRIQGQMVIAIADTGASVSVMGERQWRQLRHFVRLAATEIEIMAYGAMSPLKVLGRIRARTEWGQRTMYVRYYVVEEQRDTMLGCTEAVFLGLVTLGHPQAWSYLEKRSLQAKERLAVEAPTWRREGPEQKVAEERRTAPCVRHRTTARSKGELTVSGRRRDPHGGPHSEHREIDEWHGPAEKAKKKEKTEAKGHVTTESSLEVKQGQKEKDKEKCERLRVTVGPGKWTVKISVATPVSPGERELPTPGELRHEKPCDLVRDIEQVTGWENPERDESEQKRAETVGVLDKGSWWPE